MDFFDTVDDMGIVENHIQAVQKLEESQARVLLARYKEVRQELRDRLDRVRGETFTAQQMRGVLAQVDGAISAMNSGLKGDMSEAAQVAALRGVENLTTEIQKFSQKFEGAVVPINLNAQLIASDTRNFLINNYESSLDAYSEDLRSQLTSNLTVAALQEMPYSDVVQRLGQFFQGEEWKLERIARTELHHVYNLGKMTGMTETRDQGYIPDLKKALFHPMDSRTGSDSKYASKLNLVVPIEEPFRYKWKGQWREFMVPPDRPNDRAILVPYRDAWGR